MYDDTTTRAALASIRSSGGAELASSRVALSLPRLADLRPGHPEQPVQLAREEGAVVGLGRADAPRAQRRLAVPDGGRRLALLQGAGAAGRRSSCCAASAGTC